MWQAAAALRCPSRAACTIGDYLMRVALYWAVWTVVMTDATMPLFSTDGFSSAMYNQNQSAVHEHIRPYTQPPSVRDLVVTTITNWTFQKDASAFYGAILDSVSVWLVPQSAIQLVRVFLANDTMALYDKWPSNIAIGDASRPSFMGGAMSPNGSFVYLSPCRSDNGIVKVDVASGNMSTIAVPASVNFASPVGFAGGVSDGAYLWLIPRDASALVRVSLLHDTTDAYANWGFTKTAAYAFSGGIMAGSQLFLVPFTSNAVCIVCISTTCAGTMNCSMLLPSSIVSSGSALYFSGGTYDGKFVWFAPYGGVPITRIDATTLDILTLPSPNEDPADRRYVGALFDGFAVWILPHYHSSLLYVMDGMGSAPRLTAFSMTDVAPNVSAVAGTNYPFFGGVYDGKRLWIIPLDANGIVRVQRRQSSTTRSVSHDTSSTQSQPSPSIGGRRVSPSSVSTSYSVSHTTTDSRDENSSWSLRVTASGLSSTGTLSFAFGSESRSLSSSLSPMSNTDRRTSVTRYIVKGASVTHSGEASVSHGPSYSSPSLSTSRSLGNHDCDAAQCWILPSDGACQGVSGPCVEVQPYVNGSAASYIGETALLPRSAFALGAVQVHVLLACLPSSWLLSSAELLSSGSIWRLMVTPVIKHDTPLVQSVLLQSSVPWVSPNPYQSSIIAVQLNLRCGASVAAKVLNIRVAAQPLPPLLNVAQTTDRTALWISSMGSPGASGAVSRASAVRAVLLCAPNAASSGGLIGWSLDRSTDVGDDNVAGFARGAIAGNALVMCGATVLLLLIAVLYAQRTGQSFMNSVVRVALPSSLLPVWSAVLPSTAGGALYLAVSQPFDVVNGVSILGGILLCVVALIGVTLIGLPSFPKWTHLMLMKKEESLHSHDEIQCRSFHRLVRRQWKWVVENKDEKRDEKLAKGCRLLLKEHRCLWYPALDMWVLCLCGGLSAVSGTHSVGLCKGSAASVVVMFVLQLLICLASRPFTSNFAYIHTSFSLFTTALGTTLQISSVALEGNGKAAEWAVAGSTACSLAVVGVSMSRTILMDIPDLAGAVRCLIAEMRDGPQGHADRIDEATVTLRELASHPMDADDPCIPPSDEEQEDLNAAFWSESGVAINSADIIDHNNPVPREAVLPFILSHDATVMCKEDPLLDLFSFTDHITSTK